MKKFSIETRITLWYAAFLIVVSVLLMAVLLRYFDFREQTSSVKLIVKTVEDISDSISRSGKDFAEDPSINYYDNDTYVSVYNKDGIFIAGERPEGIDSFPELNIDSSGFFEDGQGRHWYIFDTNISMDDSDDLYIRGMKENTGYEMTRGGMNVFVLFAVLTLLVIALAGGWIISSSALKPANDIIKVSNEIREDADFSRRVPIPDRNDETTELAESINGMFDKIEEVVDRERQFTSDVSHELRTPLAIIRSQSEYALEDPAYSRQALKTINRESHRLSRLISQLLDIARSDSGRLQPDMKPVDLKAMLSDVTEQAKIAAADKGIELKFIDETGDRDVIVMSDEDLLMRVVYNLLMNAARYGRRPDVQIELRLKVKGDSALITVADNGEGIPKEEQSKIWNRFYRAEEARSKGNSTGLGLAMVESLTKTLGGSVRLVPDEEKAPDELSGAVFELKLPLSK